MESAILESPLASRHTLEACRIRFTPDLLAPGELCDRFTDPHPAIAIRTPLEISALKIAPTGPEAVEHVDVVIASNEAAPAEHWERATEWLSPPADDPDAVRAAGARSGSATLRWRPGRALIEAPGAQRHELLSMMSRFAFYEGELRKLERELSPFELAAPEDVARSFKIRRRHRDQWSRLQNTMQRLALMRLRFSTLKPHLVSAPRSLSLPRRRAMGQLLTRAGIPQRLETFGERLEAIETLYEGAVDRINDFSWYSAGNVMEITIIALLVLEVVLMACETLLHHV